MKSAVGLVARDPIGEVYPSFRHFTSEAVEVFDDRSPLLIPLVIFLQ